MPKSIFDSIINWPYHPQTIIALSFAGCFVATMQGDGPVWAALVASAIFAPIAALVSFVPYVAIAVSFAALLSLPQAIQSARRKSAPATH